jgi:membrane-associated phospholipid phosphatase
VRARSLRLEATFWVACVLLAASFVALAVTASRYYELAIDEKVTFAVQGLYERAWAAPLLEAFDALAGVLPLLLVALALAVAFIARQRFAEAAVVAAAMIPPVVLAVTDASVSRPDEIYTAMRGTFDGLQYPRIYPSPEGFPSGHVFGATVVYGLVFWLIARVASSNAVVIPIRIACVAVVLGVALAEMYFGYHWFTDCLGGAILGALVLLIAWRALLALQPERELVRVSDLVPSPTIRPGDAMSRTRQ